MTDFQSIGVHQGRQFAEQCDLLLARLGFTPQGRHVVTAIGVEVDQVAVSRTGRTVWFEYKGSVQGARPGLIRTDTLKKAIANGALIKAIQNEHPYVVLCSHLPSSGSGLAMLTTALQAGYLDDVVCIYEPTAQSRLRLL